MITAEKIERKNEAKKYRGLANNNLLALVKSGEITREASMDWLKLIHSTRTMEDIETLAYILAPKTHEQIKAESDRDIINSVSKLEDIAKGKGLI